MALNRERTPSAPPPAPDLDEYALAEEIAAGAHAIDGRPPDAFDAGHLRGAINLPAGRSQGTRAGWVLDPDDRLVVIGVDLEYARRISSELYAVGLWNVAGLAAGEPQRWRDAGLDVQQSSTWDVASVIRSWGHADVIRVAGGGVGNLTAHWVGLVGGK